jgi:hypothetical protein
MMPQRERGCLHNSDGEEYFLVNTAARQRGEKAGDQR